MYDADNNEFGLHKTVPWTVLNECVIFFCCFSNPICSAMQMLKKQILSELLGTVHVFAKLHGECFKSSNVHLSLNQVFMEKL